MKPIRKSKQNDLAIKLPTFAVVGVIVFALHSVLVSNCHAQDDYYPVPKRRADNFGFPYPAPAPGEPGLSFNRRYILDGPNLQFKPRPQDEVWLVSTRNIDSANDLVTQDQFVCKHIQGETSWNQVPLGQLLDVQKRNPDMMNVVFIHGNRTQAFWSRRRGKQAYQVLIGDSPADLPPVRFIIWSWPSDPILQPLRDFTSKMDRSRVDGVLFGQFLSMMGPGQKVKLVTYSLGTQVAFTGIQNSAGRFGACPDIDMIAMAPVTHCQWPGTEANVQLVARQIRELRFIRNPDDIAINAFKTVCTVKKGKCFTVGADAMCRLHPRVRQHDVSRQVGNEHNILGYVSQPQVRHELELLLR